MHALVADGVDGGQVFGLGAGRAAGAGGGGGEADHADRGARGDGRGDDCSCRAVHGVGAVLWVAGIVAAAFRAWLWRVRRMTWALPGGSWEGGAGLAARPVR